MGLSFGAAVGAVVTDMIMPVDSRCIEEFANANTSKVSLGGEVSFALGSSRRRATTVYRELWRRARVSLEWWGLSRRYLSRAVHGKPRRGTPLFEGRFDSLSLSLDSASRAGDLSRGKSARDFFSLFSSLSLSLSLVSLFREKQRGAPRFVRDQARSAARRRAAPFWPPTPPPPPARPTRSRADSTEASRWTRRASPSART